MKHESDQKRNRTGARTLVKYYLDKCPCGSGAPAEAEFDARGLFLDYCCPKCKATKLARYRPDVLTDPNYWTDEPIDDY